MARTCDLCGKGTIYGKDGTHKHGGMWARRAPVSRRKWRLNLRTVRVEVGGRTKKMRLCAKCLKSRRIKVEVK